MKTSLSSTLFILLGLAVITGGLLGIFTPPAQADALPANPPDPQFDTVAEYSAADIQAGFAPISIPVNNHTGAPALQATPSKGKSAPQPVDGEPDAALKPQEPQNIQVPKDLIPDRIVIEKVGLDAPVIPAGMRIIKGYEQEYAQWLAPDEFAAGWQGDSATLGQVGNTVLNGHHNVFGEVFKDLKDLQNGDLIDVYSGRWQFTYAVANTMILPERDQKLNLRLDNARWIERSNDERLTLITCWPPESNTHRVIIVAIPVSFKINP